MAVRELRKPVRYHPHEWDAIEKAAARLDITPSRLVREAALAVAEGRALPAAWFSQSLDMLDEVRAKIAGVKDFCPPGWNTEFEAMLDDAVFALGEEKDGFDPRETSG